jgi:uncharacterized protein DUF6185
MLSGAAVSVIAPAMIALFAAAPAQVRVDYTPECDELGLSQATITARLDIHGAAGSTPSATSTATITVPRTWQEADQLLRGSDDPQFRFAIFCLLGGSENTSRPYSWPQVTVSPRALTVTDVETASDISFVGEATGGALYLGPWALEGQDRAWMFTLASLPDAYADAFNLGTWDTVTVTCDDGSVIAASPLPSTSTGRSSMSWQEPSSGAPPIAVTVRAPFRAAVAAWMGQHQAYGTGLQALALLGALIPLRIAVRLRRRSADVHIRAAAAGIAVAVAGALAAGALAVIASALPVAPDVNAVYGTVWWLCGGALAALLAFPGSLRWRIRWRAGIRDVALVLWGVRLAAVAAAVALSMLVVGAWHASPDFGAPLFYWHAAAIERVDVITSAVIIVESLLMTAVLCGLVLRVVRPVVRPGRRAGLVIGLFAGVFAVATALQYATNTAAPVNDWSFVTDWSFGNDHLLWLPPPTLFPFALRFPNDLVAQLAQFTPLLIGLSIVMLLRARRRPGFGTMPADRILIAIVSAIGLVNFPLYYASVPLPLWPAAQFAALLLVLAPLRRRGVLADGRAPVRAHRLQPTADAATRAVVLARQLELADEGRSLEKKRAGGDLDGPAYRAQRAELDKRFAADRVQLGLPERSARGITALDAVLAGGPGESWWDNALLGVRLAAVIALPAALFLLYLILRHGVWHTQLSGWFGPAQSVLTMVSEIAFWLGGGFVLGALWWDLPGRRGYVKVWPLVGAYAAGAAAYRAVSALTGQSVRDTDVVRGLVLLLVLTAIAVAMDARTMQAARAPWSSRVGALVALYRLDTAGSRAAFAIAQIAAVIGLWQQLRQGIAALTLPTTPPSPPPAPSASGH